MKSLYILKLFFSLIFFSLVHLNWTVSALKQLESGSSITPYTPWTKNEWPKYNKYVIATEEEEKD